MPAVNISMLNEELQAFQEVMSPLQVTGYRRPVFDRRPKSYLEGILAWSDELEPAIRAISAEKSLLEPHSLRYNALAWHEREALRLRRIISAVSELITSEVIELERVLEQFDANFLIWKQSEPRMVLREVLEGTLPSTAISGKLQELFSDYPRFNPAAENLEELTLAIEFFEVFYGDTNK